MTPHPFRDRPSAGPGGFAPTGTGDIDAATARGPHRTSGPTSAPADRQPAGSPPLPTAVSKRQLPLLGLARHARCNRLLVAGRLPSGGPAYACPPCHGLLDAVRVHRDTVAALARSRPEQGRPSVAQVPYLLSGLRVDDQCRVGGLVWRSAGTGRP
jgi:hypothetical protein